VNTTLLLQSALIGLLAYLAWLPTPYAGGVNFGWYMLGRPLVAGTLVGLILGEVRTGMLVGVTINALYISAITPGGALAADVDIAGYVGTAFAILGHWTPEQAVVAAVPLGLVGVFGWQAFSTLTVFWVHLADQHAAVLNLRAFKFDLEFGPQILNFLLRAVPVFLAVYLFGSTIGQSIANLIPEWLSHMLTVIGGMLPAVGFAVLIRMMYKSAFMLSFLVIGFVLVAVLKVPIFSVALVGLALAGLNLKYTQGRQSAAGQL
jgi:PTS system mannose-specific IIC component